MRRRSKEGLTAYQRNVVKENVGTVPAAGEGPFIVSPDIGARRGAREYKTWRGAAVASRKMARAVRGNVFILSNDRKFLADVTYDEHTGLVMVTMRGLNDLYAREI